MKTRKVIIIGSGFVGIGIMLAGCATVNEKGGSFGFTGQVMGYGLTVKGVVEVVAPISTNAPVPVPTPTPEPIPTPTPVPAPGQYVHIYADNPISVAAAKGPEVSGVMFDGCDIRFLANDSAGHGYNITPPSDAYSLALDTNGNDMVSMKDFEKDGAHFRCVGFRAGSSGNSMRTENPTTVPHNEWKENGTTGRFYWQTVQ